MSKDGEDEVTKVVDLSQLGENDETNDQQKSTAKRQQKQYGKLNSAMSIARDAIRNSSLARSEIERSIAVADVTRQASNVINSIQRTLDAAGIGRLQKAIDASNVVMTSHIKQDNDGVSNVTRMMQNIQEHSSIFSHLDAASRFMQVLDTRGIAQAANALDMTRISSAFEALDIGRYGQAFEAAISTHQLGLASTFGKDFNSVTSRLTEQLQAMGQIEQIATAPAFDFGLTDNLEAMLAKSITAQEALLEAHQQARVDAKAEAKFNRQVTTINVIITIIMFFLTVAVQLEKQLSDNDAPIRANTAALVEMREAFDAIASEMEAMREAQEEDAEHRQDSDTEIANILRDIEGMLAGQSDDADPVTKTDTQAAAP